VLFPTGDVAALGRELEVLLDDADRRSELRAAAATEVRRYDWPAVVDDLIAVYETVTAGAGAVVEDERRSWRDRLRR